MRPAFPFRQLLGIAALLVSHVSVSLAQARGAIAGSVTESGSAQPVQGASVGLSGLPVGAISKADGSYRISAAAGTYNVVTRLIGFAPKITSVTVAAGKTVTLNITLDRAAASLSSIAIIGSRTEERSVTSAPTPIDVITQEEIKATGRTETAQVLQMLVPSLNFPRSSIAGGVDGQRPFTLRGLGPDQTLVLINGKRRHAGAVIAANNSVGRGSAGVDLNAIPPSAIDRIEVLRDGAAAQYGSDAIAGVINIILKQNAAATLSTTAGRVNSAFEGTSYSDGAVFQLDGNYSFPVGDRSFLNVSAGARSRGLTNRSGVDTRKQFFNDDSVKLANPALLDAVRRNSWYGDAALREAGLLFNAGRTLESGVQAYLFGGFTQRQSEAFGFPRRPNERVVIRTIFPNGFLPELWGLSSDASLAGGLKGKAGQWNWDASAVYGGNQFRFDVKNTDNPTLGAASPTNFYAGTLRATQLTGNLDFARSFAVHLFAAPLNVGVGAEARRDGYEIFDGDPNSYIDGGVRVLDGPEKGQLTVAGSQLFYGFKPSDRTNASRTSVATYLDLETSPWQRLLLGFAGRFENFSDFGSAAIGKVTARFQVTDPIAVRAAANTGFRAPSLGQSYYSATASNVLIVGGQATANAVLTIPVNRPAARALGATDLKAEKSTNYSLGVTISPSKTFNLTLDYFDIAVKDRIVLSENFVGAKVQAIIKPFGLEGDVRPRFFTNAVDTKTRGVDIVARYVIDLGRGSSLNWTAGYNHNQTELTRVSDTPPELQSANQLLFGRTERSRLTEAQPRNTFRLNTSFQRSKWGVQLQNAFYGAVISRPDLSVKPGVENAPSDQTFGDRWITDLSLSYKIDRRLQLTAGADNLFDTYPDKVLPTNPEIFGGTRLFGGFSPFGHNGRFIFLRATYSP